MHRKQEMVSVPWTLGGWVEGSDTAAAFLQGGAGRVQQFEMESASGALHSGAFELRALQAESGFQSCPFPVKLLRSQFLVLP